MPVKVTVWPQAEVEQRLALRVGILQFPAMEDVGVEEHGVPGLEVSQADGGLVELGVPQVGEVEAGLGGNPW